MTPQELRNSIIQLAIKGKLVKQNKRELGVSIDSSYSGEITELYEVPDKWKWCALKDIVSVNTGLSFKKQDQKDSVKGTLRVLRGGNIGDDYKYHLKTDDVYVDLKQYQEKYIRLFEGDVITPSVTSIEKICKVGYINENLNNVTAGGFVYIIRCIEPSALDSKYLLYFISSAFNKEQCKQNIHKSGQAFYNLKKTGFIEQPICLPPLEEQKRIVAKIEELMPLIDHYEEAWTKLEAFNKRFPEDLQKSILQMAIQGKLVPQDPSEGTGEELYRIIKAEKEKLVKEGLIKKEEHLPVLKDSECPFEIPESWCWCYLNDVVVKTIKRGKSPKYTSNSSTLVFAQKCNSKEGIIKLDLAKCLDEITLGKYPKSEFMRDKDIVINSTGHGTLGRVGVFHDSDNPKQLPVVPDSHVTVIRVTNHIDYKFAYYYLKTLQPYLESLGSGSTNQTELGAKVIQALLLPLPPLAEQKRIVAKLEDTLLLSNGL